MKGKTVGYIVYRPDLAGAQIVMGDGYLSVMGNASVATISTTREQAKRAIRAADRLEKEKDARWTEFYGALRIQRVVSQESK